nr:EAL domain-containing protein [Pseudomonas sp. RW405]
MVAEVSSRKFREELDQQQFELYYQEQVDARRRPLGAEALLRWVHPQRRIVSPVEFIPFAQETGLIEPMGRRTLAVNISMRRSNPSAW